MVLYARVCMCVGPRAKCQAASRVSIIALANDADSLNAIAANSAAASRASFRKKLGRSDVEVSCVCPLACPCVLATVFGLFVCFRVTSLRYARYSGPVEEGSRITQKTMLRFTWKLVAGEASQSDEVQLRCDNAARLGVHPPKHWKKGLNLGLGQQALDALAKSAIERVRGEFALSDSVKLEN